MEKIGTIHIDGTIGKFRDEPDGIQLVDIIARVKMLGEVDSYIVYITSPGGLVDEGFDIYDYLVSLGKPITTIGSSLVASMGTVIFMAGTRRILRPNTEFMIHLPSGGVEGTSEEIAEYAQIIEGIEKRIIKFYTEHTGLSKDALKPLLSKETWLDDQKAFDLGFSNVEPVVKQAVAHFNLKPNDKMSKTSVKTDEKLTDDDKKFFTGFFAKLEKLFKEKGQGEKNVIIQDSLGVDINFPDVEEGQAVAVGDIATIDGVPADGEYIIPQGETSLVYTFAAGELLTIVESDGEGGDDTEELVQLKQRITELEGEKVVLEGEVTTAEAATVAIQAKFTKADGEFKKLKKELTSKFDFTGMKSEKDADGEEEELTPAQKMKANLARKKANKNKK